MTETALTGSPTRKERSGLALAAVGGLLVAFSMPPWGWWPLSFVGVVLFDVGLGRSPRRRRAALVGLVFAFVWLMVATAWMWQLSPAGYLAANAVFAGYHALAAAVAPRGRWGVVGRPVAHTLAEALRLSFPFGGVPLATLGISQAAGPFLSIARVGGVIALTWFVFQLGFAGGAVVRWSNLGADRHLGAKSHVPVTIRSQIPMLSGVAVALVLVVSSWLAPTGRDTGDTIRIAVVQGGGEQGTSALDVPSALVTERHLAATARIEPDPDLDLVLWPENTIDVGEFIGSPEHDAVAAQAARLGVPIAVGVTEDVYLDDGRRFTNAQIVVAPDGTVVDRYDKVRRVPFGEYVPLRGVLEAFGVDVDQIGVDAIAGTTPAVVEIPTDPPTEAAVVISWEVFFGGRAREGVKAGATMILNPTNGSSFSGTIVQTQQIASSRLRAVETGRWVVQAAPTGFSAFVSADGQVIDRTAISEPAVIIHDVPQRTGDTWYVRLGDGPLIITLLLALLAFSVCSRREIATGAH